MKPKPHPHDVKPVEWSSYPYDASINYIPGDKNCVADALSCLPNSPSQTISSILSPAVAHTSVTKLELNTTILKAIKAEYMTNPFITKLHSASAGMETVHEENGFWFIQNWLMISNVRQTI